MAALQQQKSKVLIARHAADDISNICAN